MMRKILVWTLSLSMALPSWALTPQQTQTVNDFLKHTGIAAGSVSWKSFYQKVESDLPYDMQREMRLFLKQHPDAKIPKAKVTKIKQGAVEVVQIQFETGADRAVLEIHNKGVFATLRGVQGGKKFNVRLSKFELSNPARFMSALSGTIPWTEKVPTVRILTAAEMKKLGPAEKRKYVDRIRNMLAAAEKAQNTLGKGRKSASLDERFWGALVEAAWAAEPSGECIVAGWVGNYRAGSCEPPAQARSGDCTKCNSDIYGTSSPCVGPKSGKLPLNATEICNQNTEATKYAVFQGVKTSDEVQAKLSSLSGVLTGLREKCAQIETGVGAGTKLSDQADTCRNLNGRIAELEAVQCQILEGYPQQFPDLKCAPAEPEMPSPPPVADQPYEEPPPQNPPPPRGASDENCANLPVTANALRCSASQVQQLSCDEAGELVTKYFCLCGPDEVGEKSNTLKDIGCSRRTPAGTVRGDSPRGRDRPKKEESWFKPWMGVALAGAVGLFLWYYGTKQSMKQQYSLLQPGPTVTPVPVIPSPAPAPTAPVPVDVDRPTPGTR